MKKFSDRSKRIALWVSLILWFMLVVGLKLAELF